MSESVILRIYKREAKEGFKGNGIRKFEEVEEEDLNQPTVKSTISDIMSINNHLKLDPKNIYKNIFEVEEQKETESTSIIKMSKEDYKEALYTVEHSYGGVWIKEVV